LADCLAIEDVWPLPENSQSYMPHLAGIVLPCDANEVVGIGPHFTLRNYLAENRICGFVPDNPEQLRERLGDRGDVCGGIDREMNRAEQNSVAGARPVDLSLISTPQEFFWDLAPGEMPAEQVNLVVWDFGVPYGLLKSLKKIGARLRVVPSETEPERIIALHPDGIVLAGGPELRESTRLSDRVERIIGIRPVLAVGNGAILASRAMGIEIDPLRHAHFGAMLPVADQNGQELHTYQSHSQSMNRDSALKAGCQITFINSSDGSIEGFVQPDYNLTAAMFPMTAEPIPKAFCDFVSNLKSEVII
jgi:carbamoyl-phosphate synthase small subunit